MTEEKETQYTDFPICPYCGHEHQCSPSDYHSGYSDCEGCEKRFYIQVNTEISYKNA